MRKPDTKILNWFSSDGRRGLQLVTKDLIK
jgi:hypothetical protein